MEILKTKMDGVLLIKTDVFEDHRGEYVETYNEKLYVQHGVNIKFVQERLIS